jgi:hypothetical protein
MDTDDLTAETQRRRDAEIGRRGRVTTDFG